MWWQTLIGIAAGVLLVYLVLLALLWSYAHRRPDAVSMRDALRMLSDLLRLIRRLAGDTTVPTGVRIRLLLLRRCCVDRSGAALQPGRACGRGYRQRARSVNATWTRSWTGTSTVIS
jgi:hypothetical protein